MKSSFRWCFALLLGLSAVSAPAAEPLHQRIDALILAGAKGKPVSAAADDAEFLRRATLDLAGRIPTARETRSFLQDRSADKRTRWIDQLLAGPDYPRRMQELFHVMLMERLGDHVEWSKYLQRSFAANKPWDVMAREILRAAPRDEATRGAAFFYSRRLEHYGENPVDYPGLTRDVGRLFLGKDFRCAQCHDHLFISDYKQADFQGLHAFFQNTFLQDAGFPTVGEKPTIQKLDFMSVFIKAPHKTGPRLPGGKEIDIPALKKEELFLTPAEPKTMHPGVLRFSPLAQVAEQLPTADNPAFVRNMVNRLWWAMLGRGLVHPLDLHHKGNPPSHPELLDLLAQEFVAHHFDVKWFLRELALSQTYQRSSLLPSGQEKAEPARFLTALEKRLSAEQLMQAMLEATGEHEQALAQKGPGKGKGKAAVDSVDAILARFQKAFANPSREAEDEITPSLKAALFVLNDDVVQSWLQPRKGNLADRLLALPDADVAEELYVSVLTRLPTAEEKAEIAAYLNKNASKRKNALTQLAWALLASTEFGVNH
jgi:Protein of unknown function (DUF1553)/Protein of unknown function (DUF1549)